VRIRTDLEDALYVSWAVDRSQLPVPPEPLTLDGPLVDGELAGFVTVVLFRHRALRLKPANLRRSAPRPALRPAPLAQNLMSSPSGPPSAD